MTFYKFDWTSWNLNPADFKKHMAEYEYEYVYVGNRTIIHTTVNIM